MATATAAGVAVVAINAHYQWHIRTATSTLPSAGLPAQQRMSGKDAGISICCFQVLEPSSARCLLIILPPARACLTNWHNQLQTTADGKTVSVLLAVSGQYYFTFVFVLVVLGTTDSKKVPNEFCQVQPSVCLCDGCTSAASYRSTSQSCPQRLSCSVRCNS